MFPSIKKETILPTEHFPLFPPTGEANMRVKAELPYCAGEVSLDSECHVVNVTRARTGDEDIPERGFAALPCSTSLLSIMLEHELLFG